MKSLIYQRGYAIQVMTFITFNITTGVLLFIFISKSVTWVFEISLSIPKFVIVGKTLRI